MPTPSSWRTKITECRGCAAAGRGSKRGRAIGTPSSFLRTAAALPKSMRGATPCADRDGNRRRAGCAVSRNRARRADGSRSRHAPSGGGVMPPCRCDACAVARIPRALRTRAVRRAHADLDATVLRAACFRRQRNSRDFSALHRGCAASGKTRGTKHNGRPYVQCPNARPAVGNALRYGEAECGGHRVDACDFCERLCC